MMRFIIFCAICALALHAAVSQAADDPLRTRKIVLLAGQLDGGHPAGTHEYEKTVVALQQLLQESNRAQDVEVITCFQGWPSDETILDQADTILLFSNGGDRNEQEHPFLVGNRWEVLRRQMQRGCGLILLHWSTFIPDRHQDDIVEWTGGYFDYQEGPDPRNWYSKIQHATAIVQPGDKDHPICRGITPYRLSDEYYYRIRFREGDERVRPILTVPLPGEEQPQVVAWAVEREDGGRGFSFTGCHFLNSLELPGFRRMLLNALVWTAGLEVPDEGLALDSEQPIKAVVVTGHQHPAHLWRETTLALEDVLRADARVQVESVPDPEFLASERLHGYDVVIFNYCNWEQPEGLSEAAKANFLQYLEQGGGLTIVHFSNGAFHFSLPNAGQSDWPEWRTKICRRVWDHTPDKSGHDAFGSFQVDIRDTDHPITRGLSDFETTDELYFRQQGDEPIHVLATARSTVTQAEEPMAFVYRYGQARVFQTVLGHAAESIRNEGTAELLRRGTAWAAGRSTTAPTRHQAPAGPLTNGQFGQALDGRRGHVEVPHRDPYDTFPLTVECWVQVYDKSNFQIFVSKNPKSSTKHWEIYSYAQTGEFSAFLPGYEPAEIKSGVQVTDGKWHHVAMTFDGRRIRLYVDGELARQEFLKRASEGGESSPLWIGAYPIDQIKCQGLIDDVRLSNTVREIQMPTAPLSADESTIGLWSFDEVNDGRAADQADPGNAAEFKTSSIHPDSSEPSESILESEDHFEGFQENQVVDDRVQQTITGPFVSATVNLPEGPTWKGVVVRVGDNQEASICFDTELLRVSAAWDGFLDFSPNRFGLIEMPTPEAPAIFRTSRQPGWAQQGSFDDPRPRSPYGALPKDWARYGGLHQHGRRVVFEYQVGDMHVLESPWLERVGGRKVFTRSFEFGPSSVEQRLLLCKRLPEVSVAGTPTSPEVRIVPGPDDHWVAVVPPHREPITVRFFFGEAAIDRTALLERAANSATDDLRQYLLPGPTLWTESIRTRGHRGADDSSALVVDTLTLPYDNPYRALMFTSAHDFFPNGDLAVATAHGDVWRVSGVDDDLDELSWQRMATGLFQPLGLKIIEGRVYVTCRDQITILHDLNDDGEVDYYQNLNNEGHVSANGHEYVTNLEQDSQGWLYFLKGDSGGITDHDGTLLRISPDGERLEVFATGIRNGNGLSIGPGDVITASPQEGNWTPASSILEIRQGGFYGMMQVHHRETPPTTFDPPLCWIPRLLDNSSGSQTWIPADHWGALGGGLLHFSFGRCRMLLVLREVIDGQAQAAVVPLPVEFLSGAMRGRFSPHDGHLYVTGLRGWVTSATQDGSLQRVRYTGAPLALPTHISTHANGVAIRFGVRLDAESAENVANYTIDRWNYRWSQEYGSADYRSSDPRRRGHDPVLVRSASLMEDGQTVFLEIPDIQPVMQMNITYTLLAENGNQLDSALVHTIHRLGPSHEVPERTRDDSVAGRLPDEVLHRLQGGLKVVVTNAAGEHDAFVARLAAWAATDKDSLSPFVAPGPFSAEAAGWLYLPARDSVQFYFEGQGEAQLFVDGLRVVDAAGEDLSHYRSARIPLVGGHHLLRIVFRSTSAGHGNLRLMWSSDHFAAEPVPPEALAHDGGDPDLVRFAQRSAGRQLHASLRCAQCHSSTRNPNAPDLGTAGTRLQAGWMHQWLLSPQRMRSQATMPELLHGPTREQDAGHLTAFLMGQRSEPNSSPGVQADADEGQHLFESLGCIACHTFAAPDDGPDAFARITLWYASAKFQEHQLAAFLQQPTAHHPLTAMPDFELTEQQAYDLAAFIQRHALGTVPAFELPLANSHKGKELFDTLQCNRCHRLSKDKPSIPVNSAQRDGNCLRDNEQATVGVPRFQLSDEQREMLEAFLSAQHTYPSARQDADDLWRSLRCSACHERDGQDAVWPIVLLEEGEAGLVPESIPALTWSGEKLRPEWMEQLFEGQLGYRARPWLQARMPGYPGHAAALARGLAAEHGMPSIRQPFTVALDPARRQLAEALLDKAGLDCRQCHAPAGEIMDLKNEAQGIGLAYMAQRLQPDYYRRWMLNPLRIDPATKMPQFSTDGRTTTARHLAGGDAQRQFEVIWDYLQALHLHSH